MVPVDRVAAVEVAGAAEVVAVEAAEILASFS